MPWLVKNGKVLASLQQPDSVWARLRGLRGCEKVEGALLFRRARSVDTVAHRCAIDVAFVVPLDQHRNGASPSDDDRDDVEGFEVLRVATVAPNRVLKPVLRATCVIETEAGAFARWGVAPGDRLDVTVKR